MSSAYIVAKSGKHFLIKDMDEQHIINLLKLMEKDGKHSDYVVLLRELVERILREQGKVL